MATNPRELFFQALDALKHNRLDHCDQLCGQLLALNPREVNTLRLSGQVQHKRGNFERAERIYLQVMGLAPDYPEVMVDLGKLYLERDDPQRSVDYLRRALDLKPQLKAASNLLEQALATLNRDDEAAQLQQRNQQRRALRDEVVAAGKLLRAGDGAGAEKICQQILQQDPHNFAARELLINRAVETNRAQWGEQIARSMIAEMPENARWWLSLAHTQSRQDKLEEAEQSAKRALEIDTQSVEGWMVLGGIYAKDNRFDESLDQYQKVLSHKPDHVRAMSQQATLLKTLGKQDQAIATYQKCLAIDPNFGEAAWSLSNLKTYRFSDDEVAAYQAALADGELSADDIVHFNYALGKAWEHRKDWDQAFAAYQAANTVKKGLVAWDADRFSAMVDDIIAVFSNEFLARFANAGVADPAPIFILGLPRSGSTLQEQILASHSQVEGTRELPYMPWLAHGLHRPPQRLASKGYPLGVCELQGEHFNLLGQRYLQQASRHREQHAPHFIDKLPNNFLYVGLILLAMPQAKIINTRRDPMDNCFGCFKQLWAEGQHFTYDLTDLGRYYRDYHRLMAHWHKVFPNRIHDVQYEAVVDDLEHNVRSLLDYCQLPFEPACIEFHKTERAVNTASSEQVRQPIYRSAVAYWQHFESHLQPLKTALGDLVEER